MARHLNVVLAAAVIALPTAVLADVSCPMKIDVEEKIAAPQAGWGLFDDDHI